MASSTGLSTAGWIAVAVNPLVLSLAGLGLLSACWLLSGRFQAAALHRSVKGKHVLVTGASRGLGKALALDLALAGAQVTLVARGCDIEDMATGRSSLAAVDEIRAACGDALDSDAVLLQTNCLFLLVLTVVLPAVLPTASTTNNNTTTNSKDAHTGLVHERMISINYYSAVHIVRAVLQAAKDVATRDWLCPDKTHQCDDITGNHHKDDSRLVAGVSPLMLPHLPERIVLVGSILSMMSFTGYSAYSASKYAIRGLADSLRSELLPAGIKVHAYFPGNMNTPGFDLESKTKPIITAEIEGTASAVTPRDASQFLWRVFSATDSASPTTIWESSFASPLMELHLDPMYSLKS
ncbi:hypothetical protein BASA83_012982 [Batrachochytrium salamandrivorans]|nr:hypothetical protein BASA83_012982 [Batrachochytrium salamandrivorans]